MCILLAPGRTMSRTVLGHALVRQTRIIDPTRTSGRREEEITRIISLDPPADRRESKGSVCVDGGEELERVDGEAGGREILSIV